MAMRVVKSLPSALDYLAGDVSLNPDSKICIPRAAYRKFVGDGTVFFYTDIRGSKIYGRFGAKDKFIPFGEAETRSFLDGWRMQTRVLKVA
jgi:hypothetical protein